MIRILGVIRPEAVRMRVVWLISSSLSGSRGCRSIGCGEDVSSCAETVMYLSSSGSRTGLQDDSATMSQVASAEIHPLLPNQPDAHFPTDRSFESGEVYVRY